MAWKRLLALLIIVYALVVVFVTVKKPEQIWNMKKIRGFRKVLGEKGTDIFFYGFAAVAAAVGVWMMF